MVAAKMTTAVVSPFFDFEIMNKNNKLLSFNNNLGSHHPMSVPCTGTNVSICSPTGALLDRKAVGSPPMGGVYQRRHSVSNTKFNQNQFLNSLKTADHTSLISGLGNASNNKENRMRDRSFSETGERLLKQCLGPASPTGGSQVNSSRYKTELCRPFEENGSCKYGDKCQFAHGIHELRSLSRHPKYKLSCAAPSTPSGSARTALAAILFIMLRSAEDPPSSAPLLTPPTKWRGLDCSTATASQASPAQGAERQPHLRHPSTHVPDWPSSNPFTYSSQELANLFGPSLSVGPVGTEPNTPAPPSPTSTPYYFRPMLESPQMFESTKGPPSDSLSDQEGYQSSSGGSLSGSESPTLDTTRRLPIFSRLSISDD
ncbi:hypothetical protein F7725_008341 [Dissostichus mawsoni]|uniref:mRNA decay activator protein ZFP36 n=1 Tax=Dissostichus mawsoni TaxID=36200 RepID=A0A7J5Y9Z7_DISMA|nr:hypothetical protein F7725_008341 [Dissostichus mawsoni]